MLPKKGEWVDVIDHNNRVEGIYQATGEVSPEGWPQLDYVEPPPLCVQSKLFTSPWRPVSREKALELLEAEWNKCSKRMITLSTMKQFLLDPPETPEAT